MTLLDVLGNNWALLVVGLTTVALVLDKAAQSSESIAKMLGPLGKWMRTNFAKRAARVAEENEKDVQRLAMEIIAQSTPADYEAVKGQLMHVMERLDALELENRTFRAFIVYDERWHFRESLRSAADRRPEGQRSDDDTRERAADWIDWPTFLAKYGEGWRPD